MCLRWTAAGMFEAERQFRKVIGYKQLARLAVAVERQIAAERATVTPPDHRNRVGRYARDRLITGPPPRSSTAIGTSSKGAQGTVGNLRHPRYPPRVAMYPQPRVERYLPARAASLINLRCETCEVEVHRAVRGRRLNRGLPAHLTPSGSEGLKVDRRTIVPDSL